METKVSKVEGIQTNDRPRKDENAEKLNFISSNGPHTLMSTKIVEEMLLRHFGDDWHFTLVNSKWFVLKTIDRYFQSAKRRA